MSHRHAVAQTPNNPFGLPPAGTSHFDCAAGHFCVVGQTGCSLCQNCHGDSDSFDGRCPQDRCPGTPAGGAGMLDCAGLRPFHLRSRKVLSAMTTVFQSYYPDFVGATLIVNTPAFVSATWSIVSRLMPSWWGVRIGSTDEYEHGELAASP